MIHLSPVAAECAFGPCAAYCRESSLLLGNCRIRKWSENCHTKRNFNICFSQPSLCDLHGTTCTIAWREWRATLSICISEPSPRSLKAVQRNQPVQSMCTNGIKSNNKRTKKNKLKFTFTEFLCDWYIHHCLSIQTFCKSHFHSEMPCNSSECFLNLVLVSSKKWNWNWKRALVIVISFDPRKHILEMLQFYHLLKLLSEMKMVDFLDRTATWIAWNGIHWICNMSTYSRLQYRNLNLKSCVVGAAFSSASAGWHRTGDSTASLSLPPSVLPMYTGIGLRIVQQCGSAGNMYVWHART